MNPTIRRVAERVSRALGLPVEEVLPLITTPPDEALGDYALPCFALAERLGETPQRVAARLAEELSGPEIERVQAAGPYLNLTVGREALMRAILAPILAEGGRYGGGSQGGHTIVIDYSSPNIARPFSIAHLRSTALGMAMKRIYQHLGYRVIGVNHLGDWGVQFGTLIAAYRRWGSREKVERDSLYELFRLYVRFNEEAEEDPTLKDEARAWFRQLEDGDPQALKLWQWFVEESRKAFERYYKRLGVEFEEVRGESAYRDRTGPLIDELLENGVAEEREGAVVIPLGEELPPLVIRTSEGTTVYPTRDLCAAIYHKERYDFAKKLYVVDAGQALHFQQLFAALSKMGHAWAKDLVHVAFGVVLFEDERMSTRKGRVVFLEEVLDKAVELSRRIIEDIEKRSDLPDLEKARVAEEVGVGAVIFADLSRSRAHDINFRWDEVLNFEGKSGPYIQYTHARLAGVLRKYGKKVPRAPDYARLTHPHEVALAKKLELFPDKVAQAAEECEPFVIAEYLGELAAAANRFYDACRVLGEDPALEGARIALVQGAKTVLQVGLELLGMKAPPRM